MENKVFYTISVTEKTAQQIKEYSEFLNTKNKMRQNKLPFITEEDVVRGAIYDLFEVLERFYKFKRCEITEKLHIEPSSKIKNRLREIAIEQELDQASVAKLTGIEPANISRIFNNRNQPSIDYFFRIWIALERPPIEDIFYADGEIL